MTKIEIDINDKLIEDVVDAANTGIVAAIEDLEKSNPELGPIMIRLLLARAFSKIELNNNSLGVTSSMFKNE